MKIAVLGYGTIGSGVVEVLETNKESISKRAGEEISVKYVLDLRDFPGNPIEDILVHEFATIAEDEEVDCVVETMGGTEPAYSYVKECLLRGKSVCTSNKALVAKHGAELLEIARQKKINFLFEASVGGGIPIIRPLNECLSSEQILEINGIVNGTTNFILTKMSREGATFETALKEAQDLGYAERNPEADVEGHDAGRKLAILASLSYGQQVDFEDIYMEGITKITDTDFKYAEVLGAEIKLLAQGKMTDGNFYAMVAPKMIKEDNPLYSVRGVFNSILVKGNTLGEVMFYGSGAGKLPTASAVVADVIEAAKHRNQNIVCIWSNKKLTPADRCEMENSFFVRVPASDAAKAKDAFGDIAEVSANIAGEYAFVTKKMTEKAFEEKSFGINVLNRIRTEWEAKSSACTSGQALSFGKQKED